MRIRIPEDVKAWVKREAARNVRSQTAQIVVILRNAMMAEEATAQK
ncbi:hypothetical protein [Mameliella alba]|uniref:Arc-like DNA binding domain-containing protein n=1 Tax=Mameliella alba TaxID=561184 RepID=A0A0B3RSV7_9RHOB|nr:hypothetical protein [Mameliella alba]KHQ51092.1 hypothetical protein OA50_04463 [Mameliella alba]